MIFPDIESLRCFEAAAQLSSFRAAARAVGLTPAALGQRIAKLEDQLGARLFQRTTRTVSLTASGLELLPRARETLASATECVRAARGEAGLPPAELTVGTRHELGQSFILPELRALEAAHDGLRLHVYFGSGPDLLLRLRSREIDCAVTSARLTDPLLDSVRMHREDYAFVASARLLSRHPLRRADHAAHHTLLDIAADLPLYRYFRDAPRAGEPLRFGRVRFIGGIGGMHQLVRAGDGIAVLPLYMVRADLKRGRLRRIRPSVRPLHDYFRLVFRRDDARRSVYERLAVALTARPLR
jgi:LysR family transcriptional regulator, glycine cleavage system transcriptional activator